MRRWFYNVWLWLEKLLARKTLLNIKYKNGRVRAEWKELLQHNFQLAQIVNEAASFCNSRFAKPLVLTSIYRSPEEQKGVRPGGGSSVHSFWRGVDARSWVFTGPQIKELVSYINSQYTYDGGRHEMRVLIYHGGTAMHLHFQNHPNTRRV